MAAVVDPFARHGYPSVVMEVAAEALKSGPRGTGPADLVVPVGDTRVRLSEPDRVVITHMVDSATGPDSARSVGYGALALIASKL